ncbi:hypothetical protein AcW1_005527 [Taiwanofungus camphoratus]|nr:hypothetical protein AcW2_004296 [Antrodia cinnamomea]KAI0948410.1 hypothetical protein AcV7_009161 [Antrodia cinnamomea]KAI0956987.1 hypothetical protein AcW1_005527 [Antrodia cinnamomea]
MASVESIPVYMLPGVSVMQPPHLEGDPSLATEILPGPPPLQSVQQAGLPRRDHKKTVTMFSYLPSSDPGTTYTGHMATPLASTTDVDGPRRKRARLDKGSTSRAQRASARNLSAAAPASDPLLLSEAIASSSHLIPDSDPFSIPLDSDEPMLSRSNSIANLDDSAPVNSNARRSQAPRREKGKGREKDATVKVKEEPSAVTLSTGDLGPALPNEDHCSSCRSVGSLVYCDGCPRAFHLLCLDPPMDASDLPEGDARWFCPACTIQQKPPPKPPASLKLMAPLIEQLWASLPIEYQLPQDIRTHFKDVATGPRGTYVNSSEMRPPRLNRQGQLEDREPYRLKDRNGEPVLCFRCGTSALPPGVAASAPAAKRARRETTDVNFIDSGRSIISCDYCHLHWHLDCVDPPLSFMPPWGRKWMCPNHADRVLQPKRRIPKANATLVEITKPHQPNNGNIEIIQPETVVSAPPKIAVDEVLINGRRYRVPERIITLDFWNKVGKPVGVMEEDSDDSSAISSPLTSLSSLDDDEIPVSDSSATLFSLEDIAAAHLLCALKLRRPSTVSQLSDNGAPNGVHGLGADSGAQVHEVGSLLLESKTEGHMNGTMKPLGKRLITPVQARTSEADDRGKAPRARRSTITRQQDRQRTQPPRRSARFGDDGDVSMDVEPVTATPSVLRRSDGRKAEPKKDVAQGTKVSPETRPEHNGLVAHHQSHTVLESVLDQPDLEPSSGSTSGRPKRTRQPARRKSSLAPLIGGIVVARNGGEPDSDSVAASVEVQRSPIASSTSRTRASTSSTRRKPLPDQKGSQDQSSSQKPVTPTPASVRATGPSAVTPDPSAKVTEPKPTLKIRLPRLSLPSISALPTTQAADSTQSASSARSNANKPSRSRPRRQLRRQTSTSVSLNEASVSSEAGSSLR